MSTEQLLERKQAIKNRISALQREREPHARAVEGLNQRIDVLEDDLRSVMDEITEAEAKKRNEAAREKASCQPRKEWIPAL